MRIIWKNEGSSFDLVENKKGELKKAENVSYFKIFESSYFSGIQQKEHVSDKSYFMTPNCSERYNEDRKSTQHCQLSMYSGYFGCFTTQRPKSRIPKNLPVTHQGNMLEWLIWSWSSSGNIFCIEWYYHTWKCNENAFKTLSPTSPYRSH